MKLFAFIMTLVVFAVSLAPCRDLSSGFKTGKATIQLVLDDHHEHEDGSDDCPPFCACSCCSVHGCLKSNISTLHGAPPAGNTYSSYYTGQLLSVSLPIWQPPQLVS